MGDLLVWSYWFEAYAEPFSGLGLWLVFGLVAALWLAGAVLRLVAAQWLKDNSIKKIFRRLGTLLLTDGFLIGLTLFFTQTQTPYLGSRWWFILWLVITVFWLWFIIRYAIKVAPQERQQRLARENKLKYLS